MKKESQPGLAENAGENFGERHFSRLEDNLLVKRRLQNASYDFVSQLAVCFQLSHHFYVTILS